MTIGGHQIPTVRSGVNHVKKSYGQRMINAASFHVSLLFLAQGWALPVRSTF